jgi:hypothetical protein
VTSERCASWSAAGQVLILGGNSPSMYLRTYRAQCFQAGCLRDDLHYGTGHWKAGSRICL